MFYFLDEGIFWFKLCLYSRFFWPLYSCNFNFLWISSFQIYLLWCSKIYLLWCLHTSILVDISNTLKIDSRYFHSLWSILYHPFLLHSYYSLLVQISTICTFFFFDIYSINPHYSNIFLHNSNMTLTLNNTVSIWYCIKTSYIRYIILDTQWHDVNSSISNEKMKVLEGKSEVLWSNCR